jgi:predicted RNase H-like HicB family nuclease
VRHAVADSPLSFLGRHRPPLDTRIPPPDNRGHGRNGSIWAAARRPAMRFIVNLIYDPEYEGYVADVPGLPGCMSQGQTVEAALESVREAIALYLQTSPEARNRADAGPAALTTTVEI